MATKPYKRCPSCGKTKPAAEFYISRKASSGLTSKCRPCSNAYGREYWQANSERYRDDARERSAAWRQDPNNQERYKAYLTEWWPKNRESQNAKRRQRRNDNIDAERLTQAIYYRRNTDERKAAAEAYKVANREKVRTFLRNRKARVRNAPGTHTVEEVLALLEQQAHRCANPYCRVDLRNVVRQLDHIVALANGGSNDIANLQWLCGPCNLSKRAKPQERWLREEEARRNVLYTARAGGRGDNG